MTRFGAGGRRLWVSCDYKRKCEFDLASGTITDKFLEYCPNTDTLDALLRSIQ